MRVKFTITAMLVLALTALGAAGTAVGALPDGRAYELVSPTAKNQNDVEGLVFPEEARGVAGPSGDGFAFLANNGLPGSESGALIQGYHALRSGTGWVTAFASPADTNQVTALVGRPILWSRDLSQTLVGSTRNLTGDAPPNSFNLFVRDSSPVGYKLVTPLQNNKLEFVVTPVGASDDFSRIFFSTPAALTADSPAEETSFQLYEWSETEGLHNVGILPGESTPAGSGIQLTPLVTNQVSADGASVVFAAQQGPAVQVFRREAGVTVEVSAPAPGVVDPNGPQAAKLIGASPSGTAVYFISQGKLTADAHTGTNDTSANLYRYDVASGTLKDLTVLGETLPGVAEAVVSESGTDVYFSATGALVGGATANQPNLYRWSEANGLSFIATLDPGDPMATGTEGPAATASANGTAFIFTSSAGLAGHPGAAGTPEIYRYAQGEMLACVSCASAPAAGARVLLPTLKGGAGGNPITADGKRVFFTTADALVPADTNGAADAYEWENGSPALISSGDPETEARFLDADPSGTDAFFFTRQRLVGADIDTNLDVYDARVGGGFPEPPPPPPPCEAEACRATPEAAPSTPAPVSSSFHGPANQKSVHKKPKKHRHQKSKKKHSKKKHSKKSRPAGKRG
jgi:hypothetical protein